MARKWLPQLGLVGLLSWMPIAALSEDRVVIAHRGSPGYLPEHTLAGFAMAHASGADYLEPDVILTKDDVPIVLHDIQLDFTTNVASVFPDRKREDGRYYAIDFTLAEIKQLQVHERSDPLSGVVRFPLRFPLRFDTLFQVPTLAELIELLQGLNKSRGTNVGIYPEIKSPFFHHQNGKDLTKIFLETLDAYGYHGRGDNLIVQSFDPRELRRVREEFKKDHFLVQLVDEIDSPEEDINYTHMITALGLAEVASYADGVGLYLPMLVEETPNGYRRTEVMHWARHAGLKVHVYTVRKDQLPRYAASLENLLRILYFEVGIDGAFTDFALDTVAYLRGRP